MVSKTKIYSIINGFAGVIYTQPLDEHNRSVILGVAPFEIIIMKRTSHVLTTQAIALVLAVCAGGARADGDRDARGRSEQGAGAQGVHNVAKTAFRLGRDAGTFAGQASVVAFHTTLKTFGLIGTAVGSSIRTIQNLSYALRSAQIQRNARQDQNHSQGSTAVIAGYSPSERDVSCQSCGQQTLIRGSLPGRQVYCPSCGKALTS